MTAYDAVVAGGGPAGAAAALVLARAGRRVLLADAGPRGAYGVGESLPAAARQVLRDLGVPPLDGDGHLRCAGARAAWGGDAVTQRHAVFDPYGHGWLLDRPRFDALLRHAAARAGADLAGAPVHADAAGVAVGGTPVRARWVVDATGRAAAVARRLGARRAEDDRLVAAVARYAAPGDRDATTLVEAAPGGWWYTARVPDGSRVAAFLTDADLLPAAPRTRDGFAAAAAATAHVAAHLCGPPAAVRVVSARGGMLVPAVGDGWVATGDAAQSFDPLSSQGILTALVLGVAAGEAVAGALDGDGGALDAYRARLAAVRAAYRRNRLTYYGMERRWPDAPFWARRTAAVAAPAEALSARGARP